MAAAVAIAPSAHGEGDAHSRAVAAHAALLRLCRGGGREGSDGAGELWRSRCAGAFPWSAHFGGAEVAVAASSSSSSSSSISSPEPSLQARVQELMKVVPAPRAPDLSTLSSEEKGGGGGKKGGGKRK